MSLTLNPVNKPFEDTTPLPGQILEVKRYYCNQSFQNIDSGDFITQVDPVFTVGSSSEVILITGSISFGPYVGTNFSNLGLQVDMNGSGFNEIYTFHGFAALNDYQTISVDYIHRPVSGTASYLFQYGGPNNQRSIGGDSQFVFYRMYLPTSAISIFSTGPFTTSPA